jgi:hypothetical protein
VCSLRCTKSITNLLRALYWNEPRDSLVLFVYVTVPLKFILNTMISVFSDITPCNPMKVKRHLAQIFCFHLLGRIMKWEETRTKQEANRHWRWRRRFPPESEFTFEDLHSLIAQKTNVFATTAVRTSNCVHSSYSPVCACTHFCKLLLLFFSKWTFANEVKDAAGKPDGF